MAQVNLVAIESEDLFLGKGPLDLDRQVRFLHLSRRRPLRREKKIPGKLHGQSRSSLRPAMRNDVVPQRSSHAEDIDAPVRLKVLVFNRDHRLPQDR